VNGETLDPQAGQPQQHEQHEQHEQPQGVVTATAGRAGQLVAATIACTGATIERSALRVDDLQECASCYRPLVNLAEVLAGVCSFCATQSLGVVRR